MTSIIKITPLSGVQGESAPSYLLQIDDFRFLLDTGWDGDFGMEEGVRELAKVAHKIDAVLLSHPDNIHLGALPYLFNCGLNCPVYATTPVWKMGQMFLYDAVLNHRNVAFPHFNLDDVDKSMERVVQVEYGKEFVVRRGIVVMAVGAGHMLGGSVWRIRFGEEELVYAVEWNGKKERHLNGCEVGEGEGGSGKIMVVSAVNALVVQEKRRRRDEVLMGLLGQSLRVGGNVLIASDTAGRCLELILMLDQMWKSKDSGLGAFNLVFLNNVAFNVLEFAKAQIGWMSEKLQKAFEATRVNPFQLRNVVVCHTLVELSQVASPKVVVTGSADLESGFSRDLFMQWCGDPASSIVLTRRTATGSLARRLVDEPSKYVDLEVRERVELEGEELEEWGRRKKRKRMKKRNFKEDRGSDSGEDEPVKFVSGVRRFIVNCGVRYIDFEGRADVADVVKMVGEMRPKKVVLVRGSKEGTEAMGKLCESVVAGVEVFRPGVGEVVDLTGGGLVEVTMTDSLVSGLEFQRVRGMDVAWVDGRIEDGDKKTETDASPDNNRIPVLGPSDERKNRSNLFLSKLRLSEFKEVLRKHGIEGEVVGGVLRVRCEGGVVYVQRHSESGEIVVECEGIAEEYYAVRRLLYQQFAIL